MAPLRLEYRFGLPDFDRQDSQRRDPLRFSVISRLRLRTPLEMTIVGQCAPFGMTPRKQPVSG
jgi:hypothetical protein